MTAADQTPAGRAPATPETPATATGWPDDDRAWMLAVFEYERFMREHPEFFDGETHGASDTLGEARRKLYQSAVARCSRAVPPAPAVQKETEND